MSIQLLTTAALDANLVVIYSYAILRMGSKHWCHVHRVFSIQQGRVLGEPNQGLKHPRRRTLEAWLESRSGSQFIQLDDFVSILKLVCPYSKAQHTHCCTELRRLSLSLTFISMLISIIPSIYRPSVQPPVRSPLITISVYCYLLY